jgi:ubiquinone/menaquinone biosynthesis C-methylase UbiE
MPTELDLIAANLASAYDFSGKIVIHVGAGGGQFIGYASSCRRVVAVDNDVDALERLEQRVADLALQKNVTVLACDFYDLELPGDVVLLEFCLHEMRDPAAALELARAMAEDVVVIDHLPESRWSWYANEDKAVAGAWKAVAAKGTRTLQSCAAVQKFNGYPELHARLASSGEESLRRIAELRDRTVIEIPMPYGIALLK